MGKHCGYCGNCGTARHCPLRSLGHAREAGDLGILPAPAPPGGACHSKGSRGALTWTGRPGAQLATKTKLAPPPPPAQTLRRGRPVRGPGARHKLWPVSMGTDTARLPKTEQGGTARPSLWAALPRASPPSRLPVPPPTAAAPRLGSPPNPPTSPRFGLQGRIFWPKVPDLRQTRA